ncbi:uncharacterized protein N7529_000801 [Penicillium soppii]|uniref:uncharacterized protein n=1 Tax=Penicillium soppii TaxID=69789 RepID=UPI002549B759|nr:uncharacterized protein N7529_000801 [Penicillium soppii]KAJ5882129.1 hypothetical protein N7529_000801 [Penicillium soppii]
MSYANPRPLSNISTKPQDDQDHQSPTESEVHRLYFEDNGGFFPPSWMGKDKDTRRPSTESKESNDSQDRETETTKTPSG